MASNMYVRIEAGEALVVDPQPAEAACAALVSAGVGRVLILRYPGGSEAAYESVTLPKLKTIACAR